MSEEAAEIQEEEVNPLEMSDDEIDAAIAKELAKGSGTANEIDSEEVSDAVTDTVAEEDADNEEDAEDGVQQDSKEEVLEEEQEQTQEDVAPEIAASENVDTAEEESSDDTVDTIDESANIDYKTEYDELFKPFKANGREMQIESIEEARTLMQMGANYNKKMAALKPNLKLLKLLENNELLDPAKIGFLIDLHKGDQEAIKKLLSDSNVDPLDLDAGEGNYQSKTYNVSDSEIELDSVLADIKDTATFQQTMDIIGNKWDEASQEAVVKEPELIRVINEQVESGLYDQIMSGVERERALGRLKGVSDIQAYYQVGQQITAKNAQANQPSQSTSTSPTKKVNKAANAVDPKLKSRKKAASSTKSAPRATKEDFNPLSMSDEEFSKLVADKFI